MNLRISKTYKEKGVLIKASACLFIGLVTFSVQATDYQYRTMSSPRQLTSDQAEKAAANYQRYCALCHGENREGYANDHAPSLRSKQLLESGVPHSILRPLSYGREGTPMAGYLDEVGGPLTLDEAWNLTYWLFWQEDVRRVRLSESAVEGNVENGKPLYAANCVDCHGEKGEGINAPALANQSALAHNKDEFIRYAIREGRDGTPMQAFKKILTSQQIDDLTAFLRSKANGWELQQSPLRRLPTKDQYILNPTGEDPEFDIKDGKYVMAADLNHALQKGVRIILMDTRVPSVWQRAHIEGAVPMPYYTDVDAVVSDLPKDVVIVAYCSCPRAASDHLVDQLRDRGFDNAFTLYEGVFGWMNMGYPVRRAEGVE
jgi:mono/diheme cytochrome c family protein/rhodanese-related sulfurtransferase